MDLSSIPNLVHYCWFGKGPKSALAERCLASWKAHLPEHEIREWNEDSFDVSVHPYVREAYRLKKYAFVADYVRLHALQIDGGLYLDTDVELLRDPGPVLTGSGVLGFETADRVCSAFLAFEPGHELIGEWLETYRNRSFLPGGKPDETTNVQGLTKLLRARGLVLDGTEQRLRGGIVVYPQDVFSPYTYGERVPRTTERTVAIHWLEATWATGGTRAKLAGIKAFKRVFGAGFYDALRRLWSSARSRGTGGGG
jgi:hypothetical protein